MFWAPFGPQGLQGPGPHLPFLCGTRAYLCGPGKLIHDTPTNLEPRITEATGGTSRRRAMCSEHAAARADTWLCTRVRGRPPGARPRWGRPALTDRVLLGSARQGPEPRTRGPSGRTGKHSRSPFLPSFSSLTPHSRVRSLIERGASSVASIARAWDRTRNPLVSFKGHSKGWGRLPRAFGGGGPSARPKRLQT